MRYKLFAKEALPDSYLFVGLLGFMVSLTASYIGNLDKSWGFAFTLFFIIMIITSFLDLRRSLNSEMNKKQ